MTSVRLPLVKAYSIRVELSSSSPPSHMDFESYGVVDRPSPLGRRLVFLRFLVETRVPLGITNLRVEKLSVYAFTVDMVT